MTLTDRVLASVATYGFVLAVLLTVVGIVAVGVAANTVVSPPVETVAEETNQQRFATEVTTSAVVTGNSSLYEEGDVLREMPVYFLAGTPNLTIHVRSTVPGGQRVELDQRLVLYMAAARDGSVFWESRRVLTADSATVENGVDWTNTTVNMSALRATIREKQAAVGTVGTFRATLRLNTTYESSEYAGALTGETPVVFTDRAYWLQGSLGDSRSHSTTVTQRVVQPVDWQRALLFGVLGLVCLAGALGSFRTYRTVDREAVRTRRARNQYDEWISNGEIPTKSEKEYVRVDTLEDVVDVAIDTNKRVIHDRDLDAYGVIEGDLVYFYATGDADLTDWLDI